MKDKIDAAIDGMIEGAHEVPSGRSSYERRVEPTPEQLDAIKAKLQAELSGSRAVRLPSDDFNEMKSFGIITKSGYFVTTVRFNVDDQGKVTVMTTGSTSDPIGDKNLHRLEFDI